MKKLLLLATTLLCTTAWAQNCRVVGVSDGDTLTCLAANNQQIKVRLSQIDAPESRQAYGTAAKDKLSGLVFGKNVALNIQDKDRYGRTVAEVFIGNVNTNKEMVKQGYAWAYRQYIKDQDYVTLENQARAAKRGLWSDANPINPADFRRGVKQGTYTAPTTTNSGAIKAAPAPQRKPQQQGFSCGYKRTCGEMNNCAEAQFYLNQCNARRLDGDKDGIPCEKLCR